MVQLAAELQGLPNGRVGLYPAFNEG